MTAFAFDTILTLDARTNIWLETTTDYFQMSNSQVFFEIRNSVKRLREILLSKSVRYDELKPALTPNINRTERCFLFDWYLADIDGDYGRTINDLMLPHLDRKSSKSVMVGDWLSHYPALKAVYLASVERGIQHSLVSAPPENTYFVYLNNLSEHQTSRLEEAFSEQPYYLGSVDMTYQSPLKSYLSRTLVRLYIQHGSTIITPDPDAVGEADDIDLYGYGFKNAGFQVRSVPDWLFGQFLAYKIECPVLDEDTDGRFALNAMTPEPVALQGLEVVLGDAKHNYLRTHKAGSLRRSGLEALSAAEIACQVASKLQSNYMYCLARAEEGGTMKFNVTLENEWIARYLCALEYKPDKGQLQLITLF